MTFQLGISNWVQISSAILLSGLGQVTSIYLLLNFSSVEGGRVSPGLCPFVLGCIPDLPLLCFIWKEFTLQVEIPR